MKDNASNNGEIATMGVSDLSQSMPTNSNYFDETDWQDIDVDIKQINEDVELKGEKIIQKLWNVIQSSDCADDWINVIKKVYNINDVEQFLNKIYYTNKLEFINLYCCYKFSISVINANIIRNMAIIKLTDNGYKIDEDGNPSPYILPLFKERKETLTDIYYEDLIRTSLFQPYSCITKINKPIDPLKKNSESIQKILNRFENAKKTTPKRKSKVWWVTSDDNSINIFFRREKKGHSSIRQLAHNNFLKTADFKIIKFSNNCKRVEIYAKEIGKTIEIAEYVATLLISESVEYGEEVTKVNISTMEKFAKDAQASNKIEVLDIKIRNVPLTNSPLLELRTLNGLPINNALKELKETHKMNILYDTINIQSAIVKLNNITYNVSFKPNGSTITIFCTNKGYSLEDKELLYAYFAGL